MNRLLWQYQVESPKERRVKDLYSNIKSTTKRMQSGVTKNTIEE